MQLKVTTSWNEESTVQTAPGQSLAQAVYLSGLFDVPPLCSGHSAGVSRCGRCRMRLDGALRSFPASERDFAVLGRLTVEDGWRLACRADCQELERHLAGQDASSFGVTLPDTVRIFQGATAGRAEQRKRQVKSSAQKEKVALAVDFGTTSVCWKFTDAELGSEEASMVNPQMGAGSDIMSRMSLTVPVRGSTDTSGRERLRALSVRAFVRMLEQDKSTAERSVSEIVVAGNPAMMHILLGKDVSGLCYAPYRLEYHGGAQEVLPGFPDLPPCWICPLISPFVGGDLSAGYAALAYGAQGQAQYPFLLADLGTNGEFILALDAHNALATSLPLGPALEGMGLSCGSEARDGVITGFKLTPTGLKAGFFKNKTVEQAQGLSATAYLELLTHLLRLGLLERSGQFKLPATAGISASGRAPFPLTGKPAKNLLSRLGHAPASQEAAWYIDDKFYLSGGDIEEILKIKAAFSLAIKTLLREAGLPVAALRAFYLAGALGRFVSPEALTALGFVPEDLAARTFPVGNTSLEGAVLLANKPELRDKLAQWATRVNTLSLAEQSNFHSRFTEEMQFVF